MRMNISRVLAVAALAPAIALGTPAVAAAHGPHNDAASSDDGIGSDADHDTGSGDASVLPIVPVTTGDIVVLNGFARDTERDEEANRAQCDRDEARGAGYDDTVLPILPLMTGDIVLGNGFFEGDIDTFFGDDGRGND